MKPITASTGLPHITPLMDSMWHRGFMGTETCAFNYFNNFDLEVVTNNEVRIKSGIGALQGRFFCVEPNLYDSIPIANGSQGENRIDLITVRWNVNTDDRTQSCEWKLLQGTPVTGKPVAPEPVTGNLDNGDIVVDAPWYEVELAGINIVEVRKRFDTFLYGKALMDAIHSVGSVIANADPDYDPNKIYTGQTWIRFAKGQTLVGVDESDADFAAAGKNGGEKEHKLALSEMPSHTHTGPSHYHTIEEHSHTAPVHTHQVDISGTTRLAGEHQHSFEYHNDMARGSSMGSPHRWNNTNTDGGTINVSPAGGHEHVFEASGRTDQGSGASHTGRYGPFNSGTAGTGATGPVGGDKAHTNLQPYITVYYWKRVA